MRQTDKGGRNEDRGIGAGTRQVTDDQRDVSEDVSHMPRHWQGKGSRGEMPDQPQPGPDQRELGRANQYGEAGEIAEEQQRRDLTEHGSAPPPQKRDNEQLPKRAGESDDALPTPEPGASPPAGKH